MTTAINLNNAFYFGIFENYSMNGSFRLKNEEKCKYSGWMLTPGGQPEKEALSTQREHTGLHYRKDRVDIINRRAT